MNKKKLLIIDDDKRIRKIVSIQLKNTPLLIYEAANIYEALNIIKKYKIDIVICDIKLKTADGIEILRQIKPVHSEMLVIMLTGFIEKDYRERAEALGCFAFLIKPVKKQRLICTIEKALNICLKE